MFRWNSFWLFVMMMCLSIYGIMWWFIISISVVNVIIFESVIVSILMMFYVLIVVLLVLFSVLVKVGSNMSVIIIMRFFMIS